MFRGVISCFSLEIARSNCDFDVILPIVPSLNPLVGSFDVDFEFI